MKVIFAYTATPNGLVRSYDITDGADHEMSRYSRYVLSQLNSLASNTRECDEIIEDFRAVKFGMKTTSDWSVNDTYLIIENGTVQVNIATFQEYWDSPDGNFMIDDYLSAVEAWRDYLQLPRALDSKIEFQIELSS